ncbi:MAG: hypothetical protein JRM99_01300 [Nitrososphaerota archaeon]|nr:hypothetical protein [Nitrososphaerota archaeon]MDG6990037.1 hypothetical protein [Nitrososphaerota archaeon]
MLETGEVSFGGRMKRRMVEDFVLAYYNGSLKPDVSEKNPTSGRNVEYLMDAPQFDRIRKHEIWSYSNATGTGYQYRVVYKDRRFSDLDRLLEAYSGTTQISDEDREQAEQSLYQLILLMIKEGRLPKTFKLQSMDEAQGQTIASTVEALGRSLEELERRVRAIEEQIASQRALQGQPPAAPENTPAV